jgi:hypothetical protein
VSSTTTDTGYAAPAGTGYTAPATTDYTASTGTSSYVPGTTYETEAPSYPPTPDYTAPATETTVDTTTTTGGEAAGDAVGGAGGAVAGGVIGGALAGPVGAKRDGLQLGHAVLRVPNVFAWAWASGGRMVGRWVFLALIALMIWGGTQLGMRPTDALLNGVALLGGVLAAAQVWLWLVARHVRWFVPAPRMNEGTVIIDSNGGQRRLEVRVLARPSWLRRALAWVVLTVLLIGELVAAILGLLALLSGM